MINFEDLNNVVKVIITSLIIPLLCIPIQAYWSSRFNKNDSPVHGKSVYINFLIANSKPIGDLFYKIEKFKQDTWVKYVCFFEGVSIGALFSIALFVSFVLISNIKGFNKFAFFTPYYEYLNYGQKDIDLLIGVMSFNVFSFIALMTISFVERILYSKGYLEPKLTEERSLQIRSKYVYYAYCFSMGISIGVIVIVLIFTFLLDDVFIKLIKGFSIGFPNYLISIIFVILFYLADILLILALSSILFADVILFSLNFKQKITDSYMDDFPHIRIKTYHGAILGKVDDVNNKSVIILKDGYVMKAIRWDQITTMEIEKQVENS